jgi:hypothetical protein
MTIAVDIADRQYDYTDEEKAAETIAAFQAEAGLSDEAVLALWADEGNPERNKLERRIYEAVDLNGSAKRAQETVPADITLSIAENAL